MSDMAIQAAKLSKQYRIGVAAYRHDTLRDHLRNTVTSLFNRNGRAKPDEGILWALRDVSFEIKQGEVVGIIGRNGAGKSTLLKILSRITEPTKGRAKVYGRLASLLEVGTGFHPELTGRENIYLNGAILGMKKAEMDRKMDEIIDFAEIEKFMDTPVKRYSSGMYVRLAFAVAAHLEPEILIVDEVLAVGDASFQKKCLGKMGRVAKEGRTVLFVSHNLIAIQQLCRRALVIHGGQLVYDGALKDSIPAYHHLLSGTSSPSLPSHVLFQSADEGKMPYEILRVEALNASGEAKTTIATWDAVTFRIHYRIQQRVRHGSVVLMVSSLEGTRLMLLSTRPDCALPLTFNIGVHSIDCHIEKVPLSAGEYILGAGLAIPNREWLFNEENLARLSIKSADVFGSGLPPIASRALLAVPHVWRINCYANQ